MEYLKDYLQECCDGVATPANTIGMGNPSVPGEDGTPGSGDMFPRAKAKKQKRRKEDIKVSSDKKDPVKDAFESVLDSDFDVEDDVVLTNVTNIISNARNYKYWKDTFGELRKLLGEPLNASQAKQQCDEDISNKSGAVVLVAFEQNNRQRWNLYYNSSGFILWDFKSKTVNPNALTIRYNSSDRYATHVEYLKKSKYVNWRIPGKYWVLGPDNGQIQQLADILDRANRISF